MDWNMSFLLFSLLDYTDWTGATQIYGRQTKKSNGKIKESRIELYTVGTFIIMHCCHFHFILFYKPPANI